MSAPNDLILQFFQDASKALKELDCKSETQGNLWALADCRRCLLDKQKSVLNRAVAQYNMDHSSATVNDDLVQQRLSTIKNELNLNPEIQTAMNVMNENARLALCKLVLYVECHHQNDESRELQGSGTLDRSRLLEFIALCQASLKLETVIQHLTSGAPLFDDLTSSQSEEPTAMKFPQTRLEKIQRLFSRAVGWDPDFTTREIRRIFFEPNSTEYSNDKEVMSLFQELVVQMNSAVTNASFNIKKQQLSDVDQGGVTRVVSVSHSEVSLNPEEPGRTGAASAPKKTFIDPSLTEEEQKKQIRLASEATRLQQELLKELTDMSEADRNAKLSEAKEASENFLRQVMSLPAGRERVTFLQSIDAHTQKLLAMHKLWAAMSMQQNIHSTNT